MRYLSAAQMKTIFSMREAIDADATALARYSEGQAKIPLRTNLDIAAFSGQSLYMPGYVNGDTPSLGVKIVSVYPQNVDHGLPSVPATMVILDAQTGIVNAVLDGTYLTALRTGAVQGLATELMSRKDSQVALLIGTGGQAMSQLEAMLTVRDLKKVYVSDLNMNRARAFCVTAKKQLAPRFTSEFIPVSDPDQVVAEVDIITTVTTSKQPTFDGHLVQPGTHINGVGAYTPEMCELPMPAIKAASTIVVDTFDGVLAEAGDMMKAIETGELTKAQINGELGQVVTGAVTGRTSNDEITLFKTVGTAALDVVVADRIVRKAEQLHVGELLGDS